MYNMDDARFASRIMRIEDNLMTTDQHLVQLLKLDAVGADVLSEDKEKQLRYRDCCTRFTESRNSPRIFISGCWSRFT